MHFIFMKFFNYFSAYSWAFSVNPFTLFYLDYFFPPPSSNLVYRFVIEFFDFIDTLANYSFKVDQNFSVNTYRS